MGASDGPLFFPGGSWPRTSSYPAKWKTDEKSRPKVFFVWSRLGDGTCFREQAGRGSLAYFELGERAWNWVDHPELLRKVGAEMLDRERRQAREETVDREIARLADIKRREAEVEAALVRKAERWEDEDA